MDSPPDSDKREIRRPMNAFLIFCKRHRSMVREKNPDLDNRSVTRILGDLWANLKEEEKTVYTDLAKQYKDAFMKANPDYKWHNPEKMPQGPKVSPKAGSVKSMKSELDLLVETGPITPGKLADPSNMGGLSMLLMAGQQTMPSSSRQALCPIATIADQKEASTEVALPWEQHIDKPFCLDTSVTEDDSNQGGTTNEALLELAEMCSSELGHNKKGVILKSKTVTIKPTTLEFESKKLVSQSPGKNSLLQEALKETACKVSSPGEVQVVHNYSAGASVTLEKCKKFDFIQPAMVDSNYDRKPQEEESAIVTCGKMVVNHIIDKLFSSDLAQNSRGDLTKVKEKYKMKEKTGRQIVQFADMKPPETLVRTNDLWCKIGNEGIQNSSIKDRVSEEKEDAIVSFANSPVRGVKDEVMDLSLAKKQKEPTVEKSRELLHLKVEDKEKEDPVAERSKVKEGHEEKVEEVKHATSEEKTSKKRPQSPESREGDNTNEEGDDYLPIRKSRRRNRGQRYQELINEGIIQPSKERLAAMLSKNIHSEESEEEDFQSIDAHILPETAIRRIRKRTASESDKVRLTTGEDGKRYKTGDFDLEAHIAILPACSLESVGRKRGFSKTRHASDGQQCSPIRREDTSPTSAKSSDDSNQSGLEVKAELIFEKSFSLPPHVKLKAEEIPDKPLVGSRKRKARKHSITHLHQLPPGGVASSSTLLSTSDIMSSQESNIKDTSSAFPSGKNQSENGNKQLTSTAKELCWERGDIKKKASRNKDEGSDLGAGSSTEAEFSEQVNVVNMEDSSDNMEDVFNHTEREEHSDKIMEVINHPNGSTCPSLKTAVKKNERKVELKKDEKDQACQEITSWSNAKKGDNRIFNPAILSDIYDTESGDLQLDSSLVSNNTKCVLKDRTKDVKYFVQEHCNQNTGVKVSSGINIDGTEKRLFDAGGEITICFENGPQNIMESSQNLGLLNLSFKIHATQAMIESGPREVNVSKQIRSGETSEFEQAVHCNDLGKYKSDTADKEMQDMHAAYSDAENDLNSAVTTETRSVDHPYISSPSNTNTSSDCNTDSFEKKRKDYYESGKEEGRKCEKLYSNLHGLASVESGLFGDSTIDKNYKASLKIDDPENYNSDLVVHETEVDNSTTDKCCDIEDQGVSVHQVGKSAVQGRDNCTAGSGEESAIGDKLTSMKKSPHAIAVALS